MPLDLRVLRKLRPRKHRPQTPGCLENSDPPKNSDPWVSGKLRPSEKLRPLGVSKNLSADPPKHSDPWVSRKLRPPEKLRLPEKLRPLGVSKTQTLNIFQILQLTIVTEQPLSLSQPPKRMVLQKYLLSENSHWQNLDKTKFLI